MEEGYWLQRTELLLGKENVERLNKSKVLVVGLGGVGAYAAEMICRAGIGQMTIVDGDTIQPSNLNRQLPALISTEGQWKAEIMAKRLLDINPSLRLTAISKYMKDEAIEKLVREDFDYVIDAIDTISPKIFLIYNALNQKRRIISSMGAGGKVDPSLVSLVDISKTYNCPLASSIRKRLHRLGIYQGVKAVFSSEIVNPDSIILTEGEQNKKSTVGTISYMPPIFGCIIASAVVRDLAFV
jgi:tRNA threonylcarbamoyladenosine dehydratase